MTFSEFGRRAKENGSQGHRPRQRRPDVPGRRQGEGRRRRRAPEPEGAGDGQPDSATDFRQVYAAVLDKWLGVSSKDVIGGTFKPVDVFA